MKLATKKKTTEAAAAKPVSVIKLSADVRRRIAKDLGITAGIEAVPEAIHLVRVHRQDLITRVGLPHILLASIP